MSMYNRFADSCPSSLHVYQKHPRCSVRKEIPKHSQPVVILYDLVIARRETIPADIDLEMGLREYVTVQTIFSDMSNKIFGKDLPM